MVYYIDIKARIGLENENYCNGCPFILNNCSCWIYKESLKKLDNSNFSYLERPEICKRKHGIMNIEEQINETKKEFSFF